MTKKITNIHTKNYKSQNRNFLCTYTLRNTHKKKIKKIKNKIKNKIKYKTGALLGTMSSSLIINSSPSVSDPPLPPPPPFESVNALSGGKGDAFPNVFAIIFCSSAIDGLCLCNCFAGLSLRLPAAAIPSS